MADPLAQNWPIFEPTLPREARHGNSPEPTERDWQAERNVALLLPPSSLRGRAQPALDQSHGLTEQSRHQLAGGCSKPVGKTILGTAEE